MNQSPALPPAFHRAPGVTAMRGLGPMAPAGFTGDPERVLPRTYAEHGIALGRPVREPRRIPSLIVTCKQVVGAPEAFAKALAATGE